MQADALCESSSANWSASQLSTAALCWLAAARAGCPGKSASSIAIRVNPDPFHPGRSAQVASSRKRFRIVFAGPSELRPAHRCMRVNTKVCWRSSTAVSKASLLSK